MRGARGLRGAEGGVSATSPGLFGEVVCARARASVQGEEGVGSSPKRRGLGSSTLLASYTDLPEQV